MDFEGKSLAELKNLRNSGDVQGDEAQALLKQRITDVKAENSQARADRKQYKKVIRTT